MMPPVPSNVCHVAQDLGDRYLGELLAFLRTKKGAEWARSLGFKPADLIAQIQSDPMHRGERITLRSEKNPESGESEPVKRTPGEIISLMGDFYESVADLAKAPKDELHDILEVMKGERAGTIPDAGQRFEKITGGRYLELAQRNDARFSRLNRTEWRRLHEEAIVSPPSGPRVLLSCAGATDRCG